MLFTIRVEVLHQINIGQPTLGLLEKLVDQAGDRKEAAELTAILGTKTAALVAALTHTPPT